jgi:hypothetical protein
VDLVVSKSCGGAATGIVAGDLIKGGVVNSSSSFSDVEGKKPRPARDPSGRKEDNIVEESPMGRFQRVRAITNQTTTTAKLTFRAHHHHLITVTTTSQASAEHQHLHKH